MNSPSSISSDNPSTAFVPSGKTFETSSNAIDAIRTPLPARQMWSRYQWALRFGVRCWVS